MVELTDSAAGARFSHRSDLEHTPVAEVLFTVWRHRVPGAIDCARDGVQKSLYVDEGRVIFATSEDRSDSLGDRLLRMGAITPEQYEASSSALQGGSDRRQGSILVEMGALQPRDLFLHVRDQVREIVWSLFEWTSGEVLFTPGRERHREFIKLEIPILEAIVEGVKRIDDPRRVAAQLGSRGTVFEKSADPPVDPSVLEDRQRELLEAVDGRRTLYDLAWLPGASALENARDLYTLRIFRLIRPLAASPVKVRVRG